MLGLAAIAAFAGIGFGRNATLGASLALGGFAAALALLRGWQTQTCRFDRVSGILGVVRSGPVRRATVFQVPFANVVSVIDRRSAGRRAIELALADRSRLALAETSDAQIATLDTLLQHASDVLGRPVEVAGGALIAGRFEIERLVARGGMGMVYRALDRQSNAKVALKLVLRASKDDVSDERFARETRLLAGFSHPRIAGHVGSGVTADGQRYLAMQWLDGEDLDSALSKRQLSLAEAFSIVSCAAEALAAVHRQGIVHRDLKPGNLFLRGGSAADVVLLDFGIARHSETDTLLTGTNGIVGTPYYMAPEQASSAKVVQPAADIFSLGCIFYECITGVRPFEAGQLVGVLTRILYDQPEPAEALCPTLPEPWSKLLSRMLAKDPKKRPPDAAALLEEFARLPADGDVAAARADLLPTPRSERQVVDQVLVCVVLTTALPVREPERKRDRLDTIRSALTRFGCPLEQLADGSLLAAVLPRPSATDQVRIAARCAMYLREQLPESRISIATGRAPLGPSISLGDAADRAAQLLERDPGGEGVRLDSVTAGLLDRHFLTLADGDVVRLVGERVELDESRPLLGKPTPCVGREFELAQLEAMFTSAIEENAPKAAVVIGAPGIGKSRLRHELLRRLRERGPASSVLVGYGDPLSAGSPYVLIGDALLRHAGIRAGDAAEKARALIVDVLCKHVEPARRKRVSEFLGELCGVPFPGTDSPPLRAAREDHRVMSEQIASAFYDWLAAQCSVAPLVLLLEDVQWGDALTVKLVEGALRELERGALFLAFFARPEVEETFPRMFGEHRSLSLVLRALGVKASEALVRSVLGEGVEGEKLTRMIRLSSGNALFLEELIRAAVEGKAGDVPETVLAMLQARLSRLPPEARLVLRAASVFGETFFRGGVESICRAWKNPENPDPWLSSLVEAELVTRLRTSQFSGDIEYSFRHALVCDAAHGLLEDADRRSAHLACGDWLETMGESDGIVLARHAEGGGDLSRAVLYYARAAEQSLGRYDFAEALARANKGIACGAEGRSLGELLSVKSSALYSMARWSEAAETGISALGLLPEGSAFWCATVERLVHVLPVLGEFSRSETLSDELLRTSPAPEARAAYLRALYVQLLGYSLAGARQRGQACLDFIATLRMNSEHDVAARGYAAMWRALFIFMLGSDIPLALSLNEEAVRDLEASQVMYRLSLAYTHRAFIYWGLGDAEKSEDAARRGKRIAEQIKDPYHAARAAWYLALTLSEQANPDKLAEAERCAEALVDLGVSPLFATSVLRTITARVALAREDFTRAEADGLAARQGLEKFPPFRLMASAHTLTAMLGQSKRESAAALAKDELGFVERVGSPICSEVMFRVAAAEALFEGGERASAERVLAGALHQIELRAATMSDNTMKDSYLTRRAENRRAFELARTFRERS